MSTTGGGLATLLSFNGTNGSLPLGTLILSSGTLYGTTAAGGGRNGGTAFSIPVTGGNPTPLYTFDVGTRQLYGMDPQTGLTLAGTTFYGVCPSGGAYGPNGGNGTVFSLPINGGTPTCLFSFSGSNGQTPAGSVIVSGTTLYGMTTFGGATNVSGQATSGDGTIFSMPVTGGTINTLLSFTGSGVSNSNGQRPCGGLTLVGSTLYGMTEFGGAYGQGNIFSIKTDGSGYKDLVDFNWTNGAEPFGNLTQSGWTLYGTTSYGGTVFSLYMRRRLLASHLPPTP